MSFMDGQVLHQWNLDLSQVHGLGLMAYGPGKMYASAQALAEHVGIPVDDALELLWEAHSVKGYIVFDGDQCTIVPGNNVVLGVSYPWDRA